MASHKVCVANKSHFNRALHLWSHTQWTRITDPPGIGQWTGVEMVIISHNRQRRQSGWLKFNLLLPFKRLSTEKSLIYWSCILPLTLCSTARSGDREQKPLESLFWILVYRFSLLLATIELIQVEWFAWWRQLSRVHANSLNQPQRQPIDSTKTVTIKLSNCLPRKPIVPAIEPS